MSAKYSRPMDSYKQIQLSQEQEDQITRVVKRYFRMKRNKVIRKFIKIK